MRSASRIETLSSIWVKKYGADKFEVAIVEDMSKDGAFDEAIKGLCYTFLHLILAVI